MAEPQMNVNRAKGLHGLAALLVLLCFGAVWPPGLQALELDDAERFARLMEGTAYRPSFRELERDYLAPAAPAVAELLQDPSGVALALTRNAGLHKAISEQRYAYRHAIKLCLPVARTLAIRARRWQEEVTELFSADSLQTRTSPSGRPGPADRSAPGAPLAPIHLVFGDGRTGGAVRHGQVVLALEVLCRFATDKASAERVLESAVRHESVHVLQLRLQQPDAVNSLLRQALMEGLADWVSAYQMGGPAPQEAARANYGEAHEAALWARFSAEMNASALGVWMYGPGAEDQPADLGYWLGKRIVGAYIGRVPERTRALRTLLRLEDPQAILRRSAYAPAGGRVPTADVMP